MTFLEQGKIDRVSEKKRKKKDREGRESREGVERERERKRLSESSMVDKICIISVVNSNR